MSDSSVRVPAPDSKRALLVRSVLSAAVILAAVSNSLTGQAPAPIGVRNSGEQLAAPSPDSINRERNPDYGMRLGPAVIGGLAGAVALGGAAALATAGCQGDRCYGNLIFVVAGAMLGNIVGSAYGAAAPTGRGRCTRTQRFGMGMGGAFLGALPGLLFPPIMLASAPMGSVMFMRNC